MSGMHVFAAAASAAYDASVPLADPMNLFIIGVSFVTAAAFVALAGTFALAALGRTD